MRDVIATTAEGYVLQTLSAEPTQLELRELGRFFAIASDRFAKGEEPPQMFSGAVDATWHEQLKDVDGYRLFCATHAGRFIAHSPRRGQGAVNWVGDYERRFGPLPDIWFTSADGSFREAEWRQYQHTGHVSLAQWDCAPKMPDGDGDSVDEGSSAP